MEARSVPSCRPQQYIQSQPTSYFEADVFPIECAYAHQLVSMRPNRLFLCAMLGFVKGIIPFSWRCRFA